MGPFTAFDQSKYFRTALIIAATTLVSISLSLEGLAAVAAKPAVRKVDLDQIRSNYETLGFVHHNGTAMRAIKYDGVMYLVKPGFDSNNRSTLVRPQAPDGRYLAPTDTAISQLSTKGIPERTLDRLELPDRNVLDLPTPSQRRARAPASAPSHDTPSVDTPPSQPKPSEAPAKSGEHSGGKRIVGISIFGDVKVQDQSLKQVGTGHQASYSPPGFTSPKGQVETESPEVPTDPEPTTPPHTSAQTPPEPDGGKDLAGKGDEGGPGLWDRMTGAIDRGTDRVRGMLGLETEAQRQERTQREAAQTQARAAAETERSNFEANHPEIAQAGLDKSQYDKLREGLGVARTDALIARHGGDPELLGEISQQYLREMDEPSAAVRDGSDMSRHYGKGFIVKDDQLESEGYEKLYDNGQIYMGENGKIYRRDGDRMRVMKDADGKEIESIALAREIDGHGEGSTRDLSDTEKFHDNFREKMDGESWLEASRDLREEEKTHDGLKADHAKAEAELKHQKKYYDEMIDQDAKKLMAKAKQDGTELTEEEAKDQAKAAASDHWRTQKLVAAESAEDDAKKALDSYSTEGAGSRLKMRDELAEKGRELIGGKGEERKIQREAARNSRNTDYKERRYLGKEKECRFSSAVKEKGGKFVTSCNDTDNWITMADIANKGGQALGSALVGNTGSVSQSTARNHGTQVAAIEGAAKTAENAAKVQLGLGAINSFGAMMQGMKAAAHAKTEGIFEDAKTTFIAEGVAGNDGLGTVKGEDGYLTITDKTGHQAAAMIDKTFKLNEKLNYLETDVTIDPSKCTGLTSDACLELHHRQRVARDAEFKDKKSRVEDHIEDIATAAAGEHDAMHDKAIGGMFASMMAAAQNFVAGGFSMAEAKNLKKSAKTLKKAQNEYEPPNFDFDPLPGDNGNQGRPGLTVPTAGTGSALSAATEELVEDENAALPPSLGPGDGGTGFENDNIAGGPEASLFEKGRNVAGGGGGGGGLPGLGLKNTNAARPQQEEKSPTYAGLNGKGPRYVANGRGATPTGGRGRGGGGKTNMPDFNALLAKFMPKQKEQSKNQNGILAYGPGRKPTQVGSLLAPTEDLFLRVHDQYQSQAKLGSI